MSAFRDLLKQAHEKGARSLDFTVSLDLFFADDQAESWSVGEVDPLGDGDARTNVCLGRTGEEALRCFVEKLP